MNLFTYGTLMFPEVMGNLVKEKYKTQKATLKNYQRRHVKDAYYPGIIQNKNSAVRGLLYYALKKVDMERLDHFEGSEYKLTKVEVYINQNTKIDAVTYVYINPNNLQNNEWRIEQFGQNRKESFAEYRMQQKNKEKNIKK